MSLPTGPYVHLAWSSRRRCCPMLCQLTVEFEDGETTGTVAGRVIQAIAVELFLNQDIMRNATSTIRFLHLHSAAVFRPLVSFPWLQPRFLVSNYSHEFKGNWRTASASGLTPFSHIEMHNESVVRSRCVFYTGKRQHCLTFAEELETTYEEGGDL